MRTLFFLFIPLFIQAQDLTLVQINATWNEMNNVDLSPYNINTKFGYLEDQNSDLKNKISAVPVVILYKGNVPVHQWHADISFKLNLKEEEVITIINKHKKNG
jgi:hypothetical protein